MAIKTKNLILVALFAALTAVGAFIKIPIGPVPITLQVMFTALAGVLLGPYLGALSQIVYVVLGLVGLPIFTTGGGPGYVLTPTFGYLIGFIVAAFIIGLITRRQQKLSFPIALLACLIGLLVIYAIGVPYLYLILHNVAHTPLPFSKTVIIGFVVFLPGDIAKSVLVSLLGVKILPILRLNRNH
ncbi:biotin transporter BioY [Ethanoligenens sp.]|uniref:biotin transporter BioY n=1 Tax=Ethanoligenens sp. TaxID=2099655 RepID=UPI0039E85466